MERQHQAWVHWAREKTWILLDFQGWTSLDAGDDHHDAYCWCPAQSPWDSFYLLWVPLPVSLCLQSTAQAHWSHLIPGKPGEPQEPEEPWPQDKAGWQFCRKDYPHSLPGVLSLVPNLWFQFCSWDNPPHEDPQVANVQLVLSLSDHVSLVESWLAASSRDSVKFHLPLTPLALSSWHFWVLLSPCHWEFKVQFWGGSWSCLRLFHPREFWSWP